ncbi:hypothetical protein AB0G74_30530 [Streptomyces sp. NPDC020875]|uniref:hypothetical protein n=1 Tax=Streptomyces sp. NPDC020875 TaxID=3154898 RepID=UPI0033EC5C2C
MTYDDPDRRGRTDAAGTRDELAAPGIHTTVSQIARYDRAPLPTATKAPLTCTYAHPRGWFHALETHAKTIRHVDACGKWCHG